MGELEVDVRIEGENVEMCGFYRFQKPGAGNEATMRHEIGTVTGRMESMMAAILLPSALSLPIVPTCGLYCVLCHGAKCE